MNETHSVAPIRQELEEIEDQVGEGEISVRKEESRRAGERALPEELHLDVEREENVVDVECY